MNTNFQENSLSLLREFYNSIKNEKINEALAHFLTLNANTSSINSKVCLEIIKIKDRALAIEFEEVNPKIVTDTLASNTFESFIGKLCLHQRAAYALKIIEKKTSKYIDVGEMFVDLLSDCKMKGQLIDSYVKSRELLFRIRLKNEYYKFLDIDLQENISIWPYDYLVKYRQKNTKQFERAPSPTSITFIYCVKNRSTRLRFSVETLLTSIKNQCHNYCDFKIHIVEDESSDNFSGFSKTSSRYSSIRHTLLKTGIGWTRSGLLNYGIKNAETEWVALVDVDFLFHSSFCDSISKILSKLDPSKAIIASNLIETEHHFKDSKFYSSGSPYSFMWIAGTKQSQSIGGFDEKYTGHGFEDRDFELKHLRLNKVVVVDTLSFDTDAFVLHLSHEVRSGHENNQINKQKYLARESCHDSNELRDDIQDKACYKIINDYEYEIIKCLKK